MTTNTTTTDVRRTAVYVDFDNIYLGLQKAGLDAEALAFASSPQVWLDHLASGAAEADVQRRFLVARCYVGCSPRWVRESFVRAGFEVVDCPPLTRQGKNAADIRIVVDALDAFYRHEHIDEFIVMSADADFTPLLTRLRASDCRTTIVAVGPTASAYERAADGVIDQDRFVQMLKAGTGAPTTEIPAKSFAELTSSERSLLTELAAAWLADNEGGSRPALSAAVLAKAGEHRLAVSRNAVDRAVRHLVMPTASVVVAA